ncbi:MAG: transposase [Fibrobacteraceae bacterium]|nr:transposase [Fibrobacteraceae bacterium]
MENSENKYNIDPTILKALAERGPDFLMELFRIAMNEAMKQERENFLGAGSYERTSERKGYANGFKPKTLNMRSERREGIGLSVPPARRRRTGERSSRTWRSEACTASG